MDRNCDICGINLGSFKSSWNIKQHQNSRQCLKNKQSNTKSSQNSDPTLAQKNKPTDMDHVENVTMDENIEEMNDDANIMAKIQKNKAKHAKKYSNLLDKYDNRHDESEELTCSFSSEEEFDDNDCMDVSKASLSDEFDEKDDGDNLALRYIAGLKKKLTSTPNIKSFKTRSSILRNNNTSNSNKETHQPKTSLFNSNLSPLVFQRRESAFEQNRNLLTKFVLTKKLRIVS